MGRQFSTTIKSSIVARKRQFVIDPAFVQFNDGQPNGKTGTRLLKEDITGIRYGIKAIRGLIFRIGRIYCIDIQTDKGQKVSIHLYSIYGISRKQLDDKFGDILHALFNNVYNDLILHYINLFDNGLPFELLRVGFRADGLQLRPGEPLVTWQDLGSKNYISYYALFSKTNPDRYRAFNHLEEWNTYILYAVSRFIMNKQKHPAE